MQTKTLTIRGTGVVSGGNFQEDDWFLEKNSDKVEKLVISEGITSISGETFRDGAMKEVALPDTLKKIGANAFYHCQSLKRITIPEGVTTVGSGVFTSCRVLAYVKLPKTLKTNPNKIDMLHGGLFWKLVIFALPLAATSILQHLFNSADVAVVGRFAGGNALAAVGANVANVGVFVNFLVGASIGPNVVVATLLGSGRTEEVSDAIHTVVAMAIAGGLVLMGPAL